MKVTSRTLEQFITDFHLQSSDGKICFNATICFTNNRSTIQLESEVQIITLGYKSVNAIYFLHPDIIALGIPDMVNDKSELFNYRKDECLVIKGQSIGAGRFVISIHPEGAPCSDATLREIHQKSFN